MKYRLLEGVICGLRTAAVTGVFLMTACQSGPPFPGGLPEMPLQDTLAMAQQAYHLNGDYSLSGDGKVVAFVTPGKSERTLSILDTQTGAFFDFITSDEDDLVADPDVSDDGSKVVFVRYELEYLPTSPARSEIVIVDMDGAVLDRISECNGLYRDPAFSFNGQKVVYFKYANNNRGNVVSQRGAFITTVWLPFEYNLETRQERQLVDLAWSVAGWIDYGDSDTEYILRAFSADTAFERGGYEGVDSYLYWGGWGGRSVLDIYTEDKRRTLYGPHAILLQPDSENPEEWIEAIIPNGSPYNALAYASGQFLASRNGYEGRVPYRDLVRLARDGVEVEQVSSSPTAYVHGAALSRDGCVVLDARRELREDDVAIFIHNSCAGTLQQFDQPDTITDTVAIEGAFSNECAG